MRTTVLTVLFGKESLKERKKERDEMTKQLNDRIKTGLILPSCRNCIYYNGKGGCWSRKGKAEFGAEGCDFRRKEEPEQRRLKE